MQEAGLALRQAGLTKVAFYLYYHYFYGVRSRPPILKSKLRKQDNSAQNYSENDPDRLDCPAFAKKTILYDNIFFANGSDQKDT